MQIGSRARCVFNRGSLSLPPECKEKEASACQFRFRRRKCTQANCNDIASLLKYTAGEWPYFGSDTLLYRRFS